MREVAASQRRTSMDNPINGTSVPVEPILCVQFRCKGRYIANVCEGILLCYPAWTALELSD